MKLDARALAVLLVLGATFAAGGKLAGAAPPEPPEPTRILITAFEPFDGRAKNNSWSIAQAIQEAKDLYGPDVEITTCLLPVVYDQASVIAKGCYDAMEKKPAIAISLGEAGCKLRLETAAHNRDRAIGFPDNAGNIRTGHTIVEGGPASIGFDLPVHEMYCAAEPEVRSAITVSETPGGFVCNNTAYHLANFFRDEGVQYGFVHVPNSECPAELRDPVKHGRVVASMIRNVVDYNAGEITENHALLPHCSNFERLPTDSARVEAILSLLEEGSAKECERAFLEELKNYL